MRVKDAALATNFGDTVLNYRCDINFRDTLPITHFG